MFNLHLYGITEGVGRFLGNKIGRCVEVETDKNGRCWSQYLRVRVIVDISLPLMRGSKVRMGFDGPLIWGGV
ncbi:hypothetical protein TorRG33x02_206680 [Trema orientale]|uniref:Uncharacterized protein n=1 Tax=Trema orientale TaxID=63057 RepID=A0A2P5EDB0_TREOI|nr:hypothetical protein TorRG33x02_206680 [Trema orientale]